MLRPGCGPRSQPTLDARDRCMDELEALYNWLTQDRSSEADRILAAALEYAEPPYGDRMVATLLQRRNVTAWVGLVANYDRLDGATREKLATRPEWLRAGIVVAMRKPTRRERHNALTTLYEHPCLALTYLAADALRDSDPELRERAGRVLCRDAAQVCCDHEAEAESDRPPSRPVIAERAGLVAALREAVQTYRFHEQAAVVQAALWFARDLESSLWGSFSAGRSQVARVVAQSLTAWDHPRLAGFLLVALLRPAWRRAARAILSKWSTRAHLLAILRNSDLLSDPHLRQQLRLIQRPPWIGAAGVHLAHLAPGLRAHVPRWICCLGIQDDERIRWLSRLVTSPWPDVHCAAVRALATLDTTAVVHVLTEVAAQPGPMQYFAQCFVAGKRIWLEARGGVKRRRLVRVEHPMPDEAGPR